MSTSISVAARDPLIEPDNRGVCTRLREWGVAYYGLDLRKDVQGGILIALVVIMQGLASASIAQVSLVAGTYSGLVPPLVYGVLGTSRHMSIGTGALIALVVAQQVQDAGDLEARTRAAVALTFMSGLLMLVLGFCGLSFIVRFASRPALSGLMAGCGIQIITSQIKPLLGLTLPKTSNLFETWLVAVEHWQNASPATCILSIFLVVIIQGLGRLKGRSGVLGLISSLKELVAVIVGASVSLLMNNVQWSWVLERPIQQGDDVPAGLPSPIWPFAGMSVEEIKALIPGTLIVCVTSFVSSFAGAKMVGLQNGYSIDATRELLGLGFSSALGGFFGAMPVMGSLNRTALAAGVTTSQFGTGMVVAAVSAVLVQFFASFLKLIPKCALACLIVTSSVPLVSFNKPLELYRMHETWKQRGDLLTWAVAFVATLFFGVVGGLSSGVLVALSLLIYRTTQPVVHMLGKTPSGLWITLKNNSFKSERVPGVLVIRVDGPLFFANAEYFQDQVYKFIEQEAVEGQLVQRVLLDASMITFLDSTSIEVLKGISTRLKSKGVTFTMAETRHETHVVLERCSSILQPGAERGYRVTVNEALGMHLLHSDEASNA